MKLSIIVCGLVALTGCTNASLVQAKLTSSETRANDLQSRLELSEGRVQELQAEAAKNDELCKAALAKLRVAEDAVVDAYKVEKPVVIRLATETYNAAKPFVEEKAIEALDWTADKIRASLPKPDPSLTPAK